MEEYSRLNDATTRREEWMAVQAIVTGQVPVVGEDVYKRQVRRILRKAYRPCA